MYLFSGSKRKTCFKRQRQAAGKSTGKKSRLSMVGKGSPRTQCPRHPGQAEAGGYRASGRRGKREKTKQNKTLPGLPKWDSSSVNMDQIIEGNVVMTHSKPASIKSCCL